MPPTIPELIAQADQAIKQEDFDRLMEFYADDAILVVKPGRIARGKAEIRAAHIAIAQYFRHSIAPTQGKMMALEAGDTALVLAQTLLAADNQAESAFPMERRATYVYRREPDGRWLCAIDNSYGTTLLD